jgi:hypothetical protein
MERLGQYRRAHSHNSSPTSSCAAANVPLVIVTSAPEVETWACGLGLDLAPARLTPPPLRDHRWLRGVPGRHRHADLPFARNFASVTCDADRPVAVLVPTSANDGTRCSVPAQASFVLARTGVVPPPPRSAAAASWFEWYATRISPSTSTRRRSPRRLLVTRAPTIAAART